MKIDHSPTPKLRAAKKVWRSFHPECSVSGGRITSENLSFSSTRSLGAGLEVYWSVQVWKVDDENCLMKIRMHLYDERINALRSIATGSDYSLGFLNFDVLAASSLMAGQEMPDYTVFRSNARPEEFAGVVGDYSKRIDCIWKFVGGLNVPGFERLAIWALRNADGAGTFHDSLYGGICAAFAYGEKELAQELIAELLSQWEERMRQDPRHIIFKTYHAVRRDLDRLQDAMRRPSQLT